MRTVRFSLFILGLLAISAYYYNAPQASAAPACPSGCQKAYPNEAIGVRTTPKLYLRKSQYKRFKNLAAANAKGYSTAFVEPTPTNTPTPTATVTITSMTGRYIGTGSSTLARVSGSDTCLAEGITQNSSVDLDVNVIHDAESTLARVEENSTFLSGLSTPAPGRRFFGTAASGTMSVQTTGNVNPSLLVSCTGGAVVSTTYDFSSVTSTTATVTRTDRILCATSSLDCNQVWTSTTISRS